MKRLMASSADRRRSSNHEARAYKLRYQLRMTPRDLIRANLRLEPAPGLPEIRLYRAHPGSGMGRFAGGGAPPYWGHIWAGGAVLARYILDHPESVRGRRVLDIGAGSGVVAIAAALAGAASVQAVDIDPYAAAAAGLNAEANGVTPDLVTGDILDRPAPTCDLILAGDVFYDTALASRMLAALDRWGVETLVGDMGRKPLPRDRLDLLASHDVPDFGQSGLIPASVFRLRPP